MKLQNNSKPHFTKGFTLIELILVISIIIVLAVSVVPNVFNLLINVDINSVHSKIIHDINYVQDYAVTYHTNTWIEFDLENGQYSLYAGDDINNRRPINDFSNDYIGTVPLRAVYNDVQITGVNFNNSPVLSFDWWGTPSSGGSLVLNGRYPVNVSKMTGYAY